ncbi:MerR family transcriptional regulator [Bacillus sp. 03113]|uniref:MerR family transcriptional regulator n=1 Tax=Bacillus sp. 03113 TaxID=2578211 RepID=UPI001141251C|nr:MerR family transcriptional regulator [Bacillus sp. 03113]
MVELFTIGKVSKECYIPIRTLRYYDEIGLLKPEKVSSENNYRYYTREQIQKIPLIKYYKELGFKLEDIKALLSHQQLHSLDDYFKKEIREVESEMRRLKQRHFAMSQWRLLLKQGQSASCETDYDKLNIHCMTMPTYQTVSFRYSCETIINKDIESYFSNAFVEYCHAHNYYTYGPFMLYFENIQQRIDNNVLTVQCHSTVIDMEDTESTAVIGGFPVLSVVYKGSYDKLPKIYENMRRWAENQQIRLQNQSFERYIIDHWSTTDSKEYVTEIIIPIVQEG